jgi:hypothetical protein
MPNSYSDLRGYLLNDGSCLVAPADKVLTEV